MAKSTGKAAAKSSSKAGSKADEELTAGTKKAGSRKSDSTKSSAKKASAKKAPAKKADSNKADAKKADSKKADSKKADAKKASAKKADSKKSAGPKKAESKKADSKKADSKKADAKSAGPKAKPTKNTPEIPSTLERSPDPKAARTFVETHDSAVEQYGKGERATRTALAAVKHSYEKVGDHWEPKDEKGPSDSQAASPRGRSGTSAGGVDASATRAHLYLLAQRLDIAGRSRMSKDQLIEALQKANDAASAKARR